MSDITYVDFRNGIVSEKLRRRTDLSLFSNSASLIENAVPLRTGGVIQREGLAQLSATSTKGTKVIPLSISSTASYLLVFTPYDSTNPTAKNLAVMEMKTTGTISERTISFTHTFTADELEEMSYAQTYNQMVIAHKNHKPMSVTWEKIGAEGYGFSIADFALEYARTVYEDGAETEEYNVPNYTYDEFIDSENCYPAGVTFVANRLVFFNFSNKPYGFWLSKPFKYNDFQESVVYITKSSTLTKNLYLKALELQQSSRSEKGIYYGKTGTEYKDCYKKTETTVSTAGYYTTTETIVDEDANVKESFVKTQVYKFTETSVGSDVWTMEAQKDSEGNDVYNYSSVYFAEDKAVTKEVTTDDCAIRLELASDRDETICWLAQSGDYVYVGTTSSEWVMPSSITAISLQCAKVASYGSREKVATAYGMRNIFYVQTGGKKIRSISTSSEGMSYTEASYACPELFENGIVQMVWQRIPEPRLYVRTIDEPNNIYVLCYDSDYGVNAWCKWTFENEIDCLCVVDTEDGQKVVAIYNGYVCVFSDKVYTDYGSESSFIPVLVTNNLDSYNYMAYQKRTYVISVDTDGTNFSARSLSPVSPSKTLPISCRSVKGQLSRIEAYSNPTDSQGTRIEIKGKGGEPFTLLALIIDTEVTR